jgi:hypothetical protein
VVAVIRSRARFTLPALIASALLLAPARAGAAGSLVTVAPLRPGEVALLLGGGVAVLLPYYEIEAGVGLGRRVDVVGRFETVAGLFHYPYLGARWSPLDLGAWKLGVEGGANYSFFGIATNQVSFTSTFYLTGAIGVSGPVTRNTDLFLSVDNELDLFDYRSLDGRAKVERRIHYDATIFRLGMKTRLTADLDGFLRARLRVPVETFEYKAMSFYVIPSLEIGGTWSF